MNSITEPVLVQNVLLFAAIIPIISGVILVNYLNESTLEQKILPTYTSISLGGTDTEIFLEKTSAILEENQELKDRIERSSQEARQAEIQTEELANQMTLLQEQVNALESIRTESLEKSSQLEEEVSALHEQLAALESTEPLDGEAGPSAEQLAQIAELEEKIKQLEEEKDEVVVVDDSRITELEEKIKQLEAIQSANRTSSTFENLAGFETEIETIATAKIPTVVMTEDTITWEFVDSKNNKYMFSRLTDTFIDEVIRIPAPQDTLTIELITGEEQEVRDLSGFVTGSITGSQDLYNNVASDDEFLFEVWFVISQFEVTSFNMQPDPKKPLDTFAKGEGDNEDLAILFADMIKSTTEGQNWSLKFIYFDSNNISQPQTINHVALLIDNGQNTWFIEPTAKTIDEAFQSQEELRGHIITIE